MEKSRRAFLGAAVAGLAGAASAGTAQAAQPNEARFVQVWSCGGLAEAMEPAHVRFTEKTGIKVVYTGAFAGALGKSLLTGSGSTDVFCARVLQLAKNPGSIHTKTQMYTDFVVRGSTAAPAAG